MCDVCEDVFKLLQIHDERVEEGDGFYLSKKETISVVAYVQVWQQRQCMCCYKDIKNFERFNNIVQVILNIAINLIQNLPLQKDPKLKTKGEEKLESGDTKQAKKAVDDEKDGAGKSANDKTTDDAAGKESQCEDGSSSTQEKNESPSEKGAAEESGAKEAEKATEEWSLEEKDAVLQLVTKVFLMNFPLYMAYKHVVHTSLEELSQQEASALNNYCELSDPEIPVFLLRNVCFFCDSNGLQAVAQCFDRSDPVVLPYTVAHTLINILANLRLWMNIATVMQHIIPLRKSIIHYMCRLSDKDLRMAGTRNMTDLMWAAVKEPIETQVVFDKEGLDLAFKYFTCTTLTIRLAGVTQINNQINLYNELVNNESLVEAGCIGCQLADWLSENKIIEHIFGPNLHVEIIKQSQFILTFLAIERRISTEHVDCIWAAAQLKYCSKQVHDILIPLIKNLEIRPAQHLLRLVSGLEPTSHTEQTLYLASALIKHVWCTAAAHVHAHIVHDYDRDSQHSENISVAEEHCDLMPSAKRKRMMKLRGKRNGQKCVSSRPMCGPECPTSHGSEAEHSTVCVHSDLSNVSEGSLHTDMSEDDPSRPVCCHRHGVKGKTQHKLLAQKRVYIRRGRHKHESSSSEAEEFSEGSKEEEDEEMEDEAGIAAIHRHAHLVKGMKHHGGPCSGHDPSSHEDSDDGEEGDDEDEEEVEEEELGEEEDELCESEEEVIKHMKVVRVRKGRTCHMVDEVEEEEDDTEAYSSEDECEAVDPKTGHHLRHKTPADIRVKHVAGMKGAATVRELKERCAGKKGTVTIDPNPMEGQSSSRDVPRVCKSGHKVARIIQAKRKGGLPVGGGVVIQELDSGSSEDVIASERVYLDRYNKQASQEEIDAYLQQIHMGERNREMPDISREIIEDILSPDEGSCNSSHLSNKSEKNMADFEGEEALSEEELANINAHAHAHFSGHHMQQQLAHMASMYQKCVPHTGGHRHMKPCGVDDICHTFRFEDVCKPGNTLLWDLLQDTNAHKLPEGIATEAEKVLCELVSYATDRCIKLKFIEACVDNIANHRCIVVSLRLLPKILGSFQQYRCGLSPHAATMWAERELHMMKHVFANLTYYTNTMKTGKKLPLSLYTYKEEIQARLQFLTCVFSHGGSPQNYKLSLEQVDTLWNCLATDGQCSDDCFNWFLHQARSNNHHAMGLDTFKHIYLEKMPQLKPENMSMVGLNLFTQLCSLAKIANPSLDKPLSEEQVCGMDQLWGIALRAQNTDVSLNAIDYLNNHYINYGSGGLTKEEEFVQRCMDSLANASSQLEQNPDSNLLVIQRGLILLTNHLEAFRKRYAFHFRRWQLDNKGICSHQKHLQDKQSAPIRVVLSPTGASEKTQIEMLSTDLVAELRAEVTRWWESVQKQHSQQQTGQSQAGQRGSLLTPILGAMLGDGPIRMITLGQELTVDMDEKTLGEMQFKDLQLVFVSLGANRQPKKQDGSVPSSFLPAPDRDKIPMMLLLAKPHFDRLFGLLQQLGVFTPSRLNLDNQEQFSLQTKAQVLSRKVWDLLMLLPTNPDMLDGFKSLHSQEEKSVNWHELLDPDSPNKLMYSLQIVESLSRPPRHRRKSVLQSRDDSFYQSSECEMSVDDEELPEEIWSKRFVCRGGLKHLFSIFLAGSLQIKEGDHWNEWHQECLAYLLRLVSQCAVIQADAQTQDDVFDIQESPRKKLKKLKSSDKIIVPRLNQTILAVMETDRVVKILTTILYEAAMPSGDCNQWPNASWGRVEVVHYDLSFLVSWAYSCDDVQPVLCGSEKYGSLLKRLTLEAPEPQVRQEACQGLYRLCLGRTAEGGTGYKFLLPTLANLLAYIDEAQRMKPAKKRCQEEKEPFGPGCRDYFWLVCRLVEGISNDDAVAGWEQEGNAVDLNALVKHVSEEIVSRSYLEKRHSSTEDDGLIGLLQLCTAIMKHNPPFKTSSEGQAFLLEVFNSLFALPSPKQRYLPKCKHLNARSSAYDLLIEMVKGCVENYVLLHGKTMQQHHKDTHTAYSWDTWPHEEERSQCGYVGLTNLGATCYMATCMQHLFMIPEARKSVLEAKCPRENRHEGTLVELKKMFAYLLESERKAYNPRSFCKVYTMDHQPLNTGEQKDMTEFFTDLITKMEEMGPELGKLVKSLFGGVMTNNVVSLDCPHISRTKEEFYTVRCQVADMKNLYESLDEVTVKDMLEGDNMYTCSKCQKKVRAEKRACFQKLPKILCFNTMRYTFNMVTMMKEKVNTHFSFPLRLDMSSYMEKNLIRKDRILADEEEMEKDKAEKENEDDGSYEYELTGVTVHTGTAEGGHYYSFIRDRINRNDLGQDKWYLFNDAEVKTFDPAQIAAECFGGEMTSKTYDSVTDKFMDFSFEKTNSAYMLFYERVGANSGQEEEQRSDDAEDDENPKLKIELSKDLANWIWQDNMQFLQDKNIFEHNFFGFMWQMCGYIPTSLPRDNPQFDVSLMAAKLSAAFVQETLIHAKEKPTMLQWIELLTKQFNACHAACEWFLDEMANDDWWPQQILIRCPIQTVRQMFQRLVIHVINQLRPTHSELYLHPLNGSEDDEDVDVEQIGKKSCVTRFMRRMLSIIDQGARQHCKYLSDYFGLLLDFAKMGDRECWFLLRINAISTMVNFFMGHKAQESYVEILSDDDDDEDDDVITIADDNYRPQSLEKMIQLIAVLVEKSRGEDKQLQLPQKDYQAIVGGKAFPFLFNQIRDSVNLRQTCNLIFSLCRWNDRLAVAIVDMIFGAISRLSVESQPFFKMLSMLTEMLGGPPGLPPFTEYILHKFWSVTSYAPYQCLDWLCTIVTRNKLANRWAMSSLDNWVEPYLLAHNNVRVRNTAAYLLVSLVPSSHFQRTFRTTRSIHSPHKENLPMTPEALSVLHEIYTHLLHLLSRGRQYADVTQHGTLKLVPYFAVLNCCLVSRTEKLMFSSCFQDLWQLFQPKLSEPPVATHHNKQALLMFWHQVCVDCPENVKLIVTNAHVTKNIAFSYILADHEDQEVIIFNRTMLPAYYGIMRMCCQQSTIFTRQLAVHQNIQWAFKNITPYPAQYTAAVDELFKMMRLMVMRYPVTTEEELKAIDTFRRNTIQLYLQNLEPRTSWQTLITALKILVESAEERLLVLQLNGLPMLHEAFNTLYMMHHEATACHVSGDLVDLLVLMTKILKTAHEIDPVERKGSEGKQHLFSWSDRMAFVQKLCMLLNSYQPPDIRQNSLEVLHEMVLIYQNEVLRTVVPMLEQAHMTFQDNSIQSIPNGPYFPKKGQKVVIHKSSLRPPRPCFQMFLHSNMVEAPKHEDESYDSLLYDYFNPYQRFVDLLIRVAVNQKNLSAQTINLSALVALEGAPIHLPYFAKLWYEIYQSEHTERRYINMLCSTGAFLDYVSAVLLEERYSLNDQYIYQFFANFFPRVYKQVFQDHRQALDDNLLDSLMSNLEELQALPSDKERKHLLMRINGDLRAMLLYLSVWPPKKRNVPKNLMDSMKCVHDLVVSLQKKQQKPAPSGTKPDRQKETQKEKETRKEEEDLGEAPAKRRRTSSESQDESKSKKVEPDGPEGDHSPTQPEKSKENPSEKDSSEKPDAKGDSASPDKPSQTNEAATDKKEGEEMEEEEEEPVPSSSKSAAARTLTAIEKPTIADLVAKNICMIFKLLKSSS